MIPMLEIVATRSPVPFRDGFPTWAGAGNPYPVVGWRVRRADGTFGTWIRAGSGLYVGPLLLASPLGYVKFIEGYTGTEAGSLQKAGISSVPPIQTGLFVGAPDAAVSIPTDGSGAGPGVSSPAVVAVQSEAPQIAASVRPVVDRSLADNGPPAPTSTGPRPEDAITVVGWLFVAFVGLALLAVLRRR